MKALVVNKEFMGRSIGDIEHIGLNSEIDSMEGNYISTHMSKVNIPAELEGKPIKSVELTPADEFWSKEGEADVYEAPIIENHWIKDGEVAVFEAPMAEEFWSKEGESNSSILPMLDEFWSKEGEANVSVDPVDEAWEYHAPEPDDSWIHTPTQVDGSWAHVPAVVDDSYEYHVEIVEGQRDLVLDSDIDTENQVNAKYSDMQTSVYVDLESVFGSKNDNTSTRRYLSALAMKNDPTFFAGKGMIAEISTTSFSVGDSLDTSGNVTSYADEVIAQANQFIIDANLKIKQFLIDKSDIEAAN